MFASPLAFVPTTMATTQYRKFADVKRISPKCIKITVLLGLIVMFALWAIVPLVLKWFYSAEFNEVIRLNYIVSFGVLLYGMADFFNRFISAKGQGKMLRNSSFIVGLTLLIANFILVPLFGAIGASCAKVIAGFIYLLIMLLCYHKTLKLQSTIQNR